MSQKAIKTAVQIIEQCNDEILELHKGRNRYYAVVIVDTTQGDFASLPKDLGLPTRSLRIDEQLFMAAVAPVSYVLKTFSHANFPKVAAALENPRMLPNAFPVVVLMQSGTSIFALAFTAIHAETND